MRWSSAAERAPGPRRGASESRVRRLLLAAPFGLRAFAVFTPRTGPPSFLTTAHVVPRATRIAATFPPDRAPLHRDADRSARPPTPTRLAAHRGGRTSSPRSALGARATVRVGQPRPRAGLQSLRPSQHTGGRGVGERALRAAACRAARARAPLIETCLQKPTRRSSGASPGGRPLVDLAADRVMRGQQRHPFPAPRAICFATSIDTVKWVVSQASLREEAGVAPRLPSAPRPRHGLPLSRAASRVQNFDFRHAPPHRRRSSRSEDPGPAARLPAVEPGEPRRELRGPGGERHRRPAPPCSPRSRIGRPAHANVFVRRHREDRARRHAEERVEVFDRRLASPLILGARVRWSEMRVARRESTRSSALCRGPALGRPCFRCAHNTATNQPLPAGHAAPTWARRDRHGRELDRAVVFRAPGWRAPRAPFAHGPVLSWAAERSRPARLRPLARRRADQQRFYLFCQPRSPPAYYGRYGREGLAAVFFAARLLAGFEERDARLSLSTRGER